MLRGAPQRRLILVPIIHTPGDMGRLGQRLPADEARQQLAQERWAEIQQQVRGLGLDWPKVKVYQDGLPDAEPEVVQKILSEVESPNYDLLRWLAAQGAELVGTESPFLLKQEYDYLRAVLDAPDTRAKARARSRYAARAGALLAERDAYMARRIAETLAPGGIGLLFVGQTHAVAARLPADIAVQTLLHGRTVTAPARTRTE